MLIYISLSCILYDLHLDQFQNSFLLLTFFGSTWHEGFKDIFGVLSAPVSEVKNESLYLGGKLLQHSVMFTAKFYEIIPKQKTAFNSSS